MSDRITLADRLVGLMRIADEAKELARKTADRPSETPRFEIEMAVDEQLNGIASAFMVAWSNVDRLRLLARWHAERADSAAPTGEAK